jgi:capsular polysaccharide transport system permease protein
LVDQYLNGFLKIVTQPMLPKADAFGRHFAVLRAMLVRAVDSRRQAPFHTIFALLEPLFLMTVLSGLWFLLNRHQTVPFGDSVLLFYATGIFPYYFFVYVSRRMRIPAPKRRFPIERRLDYVLVHLVLRLFDYIVLGLILFGGLRLFVTHTAMPESFFPLFEGAFAILLLSFGWGLLLISLRNSFPLWTYLHPSISRALILITGIFYVPDFLSPSARYLMSFNPLVHAVALFRTGFYPNYPTLLLDRWYLFACSVAFVVMGFVLERLTIRTETRPLIRPST